MADRNHGAEQNVEFPILRLNMTIRWKASAAWKMCSFKPRMDTILSKSM